MRSSSGQGRGLLVGLCLLLAACTDPARAPVARGDADARPATGRGVVLSLTDLHFDPFRDPALFPALARAAPADWARIFERSPASELGPYGRDTSYALLTSAFGHAARVARDADFIALTGDWLAHGFNETYYQLAGNRDPRGLHEFIDKTVAFLALRLREHFPHTPIYAALGNEDSYCGDYQLEPRGPFLQRTAERWRGFLDGPGNERAFADTFPIGGYYAVSAPRAPAHRLLVLNTVFFSANYDNRCGNRADDPAGDELSWLTAQLEEAAARGHRVWLLYHIPPGIDAFSTARAAGAGRLGDIVPFWHPDRTEAFLVLVARHREHIALMLAGHTHMDDFRLVPPASGGRGPGFLLITPAISPIFGNNPGFHVLSYDRRTFAPQDYTAHRLDLAAGAGARWAAEYRFSQAYGLSPVGGDALAALFRRLGEARGSERAAYVRYYNVSHVAEPPITDHSWPIFWCAIGHVTAAAFRSCVEAAPRP
jgi:sphingomyelin phosphodiesterase acid-like 3